MSHLAQLTYVGGYTHGIVLAHRDRLTGALTDASTVAVTPSPSFLARHPDLPVLYAVNELEEGAVSAFGVAAGGALTPLGSWPTGGAHPCHVAVSTAGAGHLLVANFGGAGQRSNVGGGSVAVLPLGPDGVPKGHSHVSVHSGRGQHPSRQEAPHAHMVVPTAFGSADQRSYGLLAVDLGLDVVYAYRLDPATGALSSPTPAISAPPGSGPRHLVQDPAGRLHVVGELDATVTTYEPDGDGWREAGRSPTSGVAGSQPSEIDISDDGRFLYVGNRGPDTVGVLAVSGDGPRFVSEVPVGEWPRHFALIEGWLYVANERSGSVTVFRLDPATGLPAPTGDALSTPSPTCVLPF